MDWRDRITVDSKVLMGKPVIKGTRIAVEFVVERRLKASIDRP